MRQREGVIKIKDFLSFASRHKTPLASLVVTLALMGVPTVAGADVIESGFTSASASLVTYLGYGIALVLAVLLLGMGIRMLIKWTRRGVSAT